MKSTEVQTLGVINAVQYNHILSLCSREKYLFIVTVTKFRSLYTATFPLSVHRKNEERTRKISPQLIVSVVKYYIIMYMMCNVHVLCVINL